MPKDFSPFARRIVVAAAAALGLYAGGALAETAAPVWKPLLAAPEAVALARSGEALLIDLREPEAYALDHAAGAASAPYDAWRGPKTNPGALISDEKLSALLQSLGAKVDRPTMLFYAGFNPTNFGAAARVYWTLKSAGFTQIAIVNGGLEAWKAAEGPVSTEPTTPSLSAIEVTLSDAYLADWETVTDTLDGVDRRALIDARPTAFYLGLMKHREAVKAGTLPGARRLEHDVWFKPLTAEMNEDADYARRVLAATGALEGAEGATVFCNTGHWAATTWFALSELAGASNVKLYAGSLVDWTQTGGEVVAGER